MAKHISFTEQKRLESDSFNETGALLKKYYQFTTLLHSLTTSCIVVLESNGLIIVWTKAF